MRGLVFAIVLLAALIGCGWLFLRGGDGPPLQPGGTAGGSPATASPATAGSTNGANAANGTAPANAAAFAAPELRTPVDLADRPTAFLQVLDANTNAPVPGAAVYRFDTHLDTAAITYTDAGGIAAIPLKKPEQLIVAIAGYLLRQAPTQPGSTAEHPQQVLLQPDRYSLRVRFQFVLPDDSRPPAVLVRLRPSSGKTDPPPPPGLAGANESVQRAWLEQRTIAQLRPVPEVHVQLGRHNQERVLRLEAADDVSFAAAGLFELDAATAAGFVARATFDVGSVTGEPFVVRMQPGKNVEGYVTSNVTNAPVGNAEVVLNGGDPLDLKAITDAAGHFVLGPLADGMVSVEVRHRDHEIGRAGPLAAGTTGVRVQLAALPATAVRGRVRARPSLQPLAGATATISDPLGKPITATTDQDGWFVLRGSGKDTLRVVLSAPGFQPYSELLDPGAPVQDYDLWPGDAETRLRAKMTGVLTGIVVDETGQPLANASVRLQPDRALPPPPIGGRRVLLGGALLLPLMTTSGPDGSFVLETQCDGGGSLSVLDPTAGAQPGVRTAVVLGETVRDLRIVGKRRQ